MTAASGCFTKYCIWLDRLVYITNTDVTPVILSKSLKTVYETPQKADTLNHDLACERRGAPPGMIIPTDLHP